MSLSDFLADDSKIHKLVILFFLAIFCLYPFISILATGGSSWADDVADLPSARKFLFSTRKKIFVSFS